MAESGTTESSMAGSGPQGEPSGKPESDFVEGLQLFMSVVGYEIEYGRSTDSSEPPQPISSWVQVNMSVKGATVEHHAHKPIKRAIVVFTDRDLEETRVGNLFRQPDSDGLAIFARLPYADFPAFWAALRLERVAKLTIMIHRGTNNVLTMSFQSQGELFPLFGI
jgi:hypothetical protein